jgi:hypothetical protein
MKGVMVDIETLGNKVDSVMLSISAVQFNEITGETGSEFHMDISPESCIEAGLKMNPDTVMWWFKQNEEARMKMVEVYEGNSMYQLATVLDEFNNWINNNFDEDEVELWGNSNRFDLGIICKSMDAVGVKPIWKHWNEKDVRTLSGIIPRFKKEEVFTGVKHYGIDDCKFQIAYCSKVMKMIIMGLGSLSQNNQV